MRFDTRKFPALFLSVLMMFNCSLGLPQQTPIENDKPRVLFEQELIRYVKSTVQNPEELEKKADQLVSHMWPSNQEVEFNQYYMPSLELIDEMTEVIAILQTAGAATNITLKTKIFSNALTHRIDTLPGITSFVKATSQYFSEEFKSANDRAAAARALVESAAIGVENRKSFSILTDLKFVSEAHRPVHGLGYFKDNLTELNNAIQTFNYTPSFKTKVRAAVKKSISYGLVGAYAVGLPSLFLGCFVAFAGALGGGNGGQGDEVVRGILFLGFGIGALIGGVNGWKSPNKEMNEIGNYIKGVGDKNCEALLGNIRP